METPPKLPIEDRAYGIIPLRFLPNTPSNAEPSPSNTQILLIHQITTNPNFPRYWGFPKGHAEESDLSPKHTAVRELLEETGLKVELGDILDLKSEGKGEVDEGRDNEVGKEREGDEFGDTPFRQYSVNPYKNIGKETRFWVGIVRGEQEVRLQTEEVDEYKWCGWEEAMGCITFEDTRGVLRMVVGPMGEDLRI
jgi:8-oxo-dGTP pyrophosphatase MutT (NUDIX family)